MNRTLASLVIVGLLGTSTRAASEPKAVPAIAQCTLDGKPIQPTFLSLNGTPEQPAAGDLVWVGEYFLVYDPETLGDFRSTPEEDGRLLFRTKEGKERVVGARIVWTFQGDKKVVFNPLARLSDAEVRGLRGILIDEWNDQIADRLRHLDPQRACVTLSGNTGQEPGGSLPPLPPGLLYLNINAISGNTISDFSRLRDQTALRFLVVHATGGVVDGRDLAQACKLTYLDVSGDEIRNLAELASLSELRTIDLAYTRGTDALSFATPLRHLTILDIRGTQVRDLSPLGGLTSLRELDANRTRAETLPKGTFGDLRQLAVMSTSLDDGTVASFAAAHLRCRVRFRWVPALRDVLRGITRLRVRTGGTCHRDPGGEKTLFETQDGAQVSEFLDQIRIEEAHEEFCCMCCGEPTFEFYRGDKLVLALGFHHGQSLRWPGGWPGDGALSEESALALCQWLSKHGAPDSLKQHQAEKRARLAALRRTNEYARLLPKGVLDRLRNAQSPDEAAAAFQSGPKDSIDRATLLLSLFGCDLVSWNVYSGLDDLLKETLLPKITQEELVKALARGPDPAMLNGAARWLFCEEKWKTLDREALKAVIPVVARAALAHPREVNRRMTLRALSEVPGSIGAPYLRMVVDQPIPVRKLAEPDQAEPGGMMMVRPGDDEVTGGSDQAVAALLLAKSGDRESFAAIRRPAQNAMGQDKVILRRALKLLGADH